MTASNVNRDLPAIDWFKYLVGADPYLVWAEISNFRGYEVDAELYYVVVETSTAAPPLVASGRDLSPTLIKICSSGLNNGGSIYTGAVDGKTLGELIGTSGLRVEMNLPKFTPISIPWASGEHVYADREIGISKIVIAVIDHGCPFVHRQLTAGQRTRVRYLWDQDPNKTAVYIEGSPRLEAPWFPVKDFLYGRELTGSVIEGLIQPLRNSVGVIDEDAVYQATHYAAMDDRKTHGAHVMDVAAGRLDPLSGKEDAASTVDVIFVQLPRSTIADTSGGSMTKYVLDALKYILDQTKDATHLAINLSYGSTAGPHDGSTMLERAMDQLVESARDSIPTRQVELVLPAGNHFLAKLHGAVTLDDTNKFSAFLWQVSPDVPTDSFLELWYPKTSVGQISVRVTSPSGQTQATVGANDFSKLQSHAGELIGTVVHSGTVPNGQKAMVLIALGPTHASSMASAEHGLWRIEVSYSGTESVEVMAWVERDDPLPGQGGQPQSQLFENRLRMDPDDDDVPSDTVKRRTTGNSLANGKNPIVVGAKVQATDALSAYTAAGPTLSSAQRRWPNALAIGDESDSQPGILAAGTRSGIEVRMNGTSVAAPQVVRKLVNMWAADPSYRYPRPSIPVPTAQAPTIRQERGGT